MSDNSPQNVEILVEANASEATRAAAAVAKEITAVVGQVAALETKLKSIFAGQLPKQLEQAQNYLRTLQTASKTAALLAQGGPEIQMKNAAFAAEMAKLRADGVTQTLRMERELNKVLKEREAIFNRSQQNLPLGASERSGLRMYRDQLRMAGGGPAEGQSRAWFEQTRNQYRYFLQRQTADLEAELQKRNAKHQAAILQQEMQEKASMDKRNMQARLQVLQQESLDEKRLERERQMGEKRNLQARLQLLKEEQLELASIQKREAAEKASLDRRARTYEARFARQFGNLSKIDDPTKQNAAAQSAINALAQRASAQGLTLDQTRMMSAFQDYQFERNLVPVAPKTPKQPKPAIPREQTIGNTLQNIRDRYSYQGGAGMFTVQADIMRNYATMAAILASVGYAARSTVEFQTAMKDVQAIAGATNIELKALTSTVFEVGNSTRFSAKEIADGVKILAQAGYSVQQIQEMVKPISDLATGSGASFQDSANTVTSVLSVFDLSTSRTTEVVNTLTAGLNQSKLSMEQLSLGIQYAGNMAADGGIQFEELVAALGAMSNAGIKSGSTLGTGLRALVEELENPSTKFLETLRKIGLTEEDVNVKTHSLAQVMETLKGKGFDSAAAMGSFEIRAAAAFSALSNNLNVFQDLQENIVGTTAATDAAGVQMETFTAQWQRLLNAVTEISYVAGAPVLGTLTALISTMADLTHSAAGSTQAVQFFGTVLASIATASAIVWISKLIMGLIGISTASAAAATATVVTNIRLAVLSLQMKETALAAGLVVGGLRAMAVAMLSSPVALLTVALTGISLVIGHTASQQATLNQQLEEYATKANDAKAKAEEYQNRIQEVDKYISVLIDRHATLADNTQLAAAEAEKAGSKFAQWGLELQGNARDIDNLIGRMVQLRSEMSKLAADQAVIQRDAMEQERTAVGDLVKGNVQKTHQLAAPLRSVQGAQGIFDQINNTANPTAAQAQAWSAQLIGLKAKLPKSQKDIIDKVVSSLGDVATNTSKYDTLGRQISTTSSNIATSTAMTTPEAQYITRSALGMQGAWKDQLANALSIKDPAARSKALADLQKTFGQDYFALQGLTAEKAAALAQNPSVRAELEQRAARNKTTPEGEAMRMLIEQTPGMSSMAIQAGQYSPNSDPKALRARRDALKAQLALEKKTTKNPDQIKSLNDQITSINKLLILNNGDLDVSQAQYMAEQADLEGSARTQSDLAGVSGRGSGRRRSNASVKALERQIEQVAGQAGPDAAGIAAARPKLQALLQDWKTAKRAANPEADLADFNTTAQEYIDKILNGNIQAAKDWLAERAKEDADNAAQDMAAKVRSGEISIDDAIMEVNETFTDAAKKSVEASNEKLKAKYGASFDPKLSAEAIDANRKIIRDIVQANLDAAKAILDAAGIADTNYFAGRKAVRSDRRALIGAMSNAYGSRNISDIRRYLGGVETQKLDIQDQQDVVESLQRELSRKETLAGQTSMQLAADPTNAALKDKLAAAQQSAVEMAQALQEAKRSLREMTYETEPLASATDAIKTAWQAYSDQIGLSKPMFEQLGDGVTGIFDTARTSFKTLVVDVMSGSKSMGSAIKDFAMSVLQSMLDLAAQMLANAAIKWLISTVIGAFGGTPAAAKGVVAPASSGIGLNPFVAIQGGQVPKRFAQGSPAPFRDSVHALLQPGEVVMNRSAVSFMGADNLLEMNRQGNRRLSQMPSMQAMKREPDNVNVWVVAPETKPQVGKKDIVATISDDILTGGSVKKLIKAVQMGGL